MIAAKPYDCALVGGGVAGLALAICQARAGRTVVLFEKKNYPFHKVCGEYLSSECHAFLEGLGVPLAAYGLPVIKQLLLTSPKGFSLRQPLAIGGTGLSRYMLDEQLYRLAVTAGATVHTGITVESIVQQPGGFEIRAGGNVFRARVAVGAYGKQADLLSEKSPLADRDYIAVKHHLRVDFDPSWVEMHNFPGGYCGMSAIEEGKMNLSYICKTSVLQQYRSTDKLQKKVLSTNPYLRHYFETATFLFEKPLTISRMHFQIRTPVQERILLLGDAAGNIAPLSGNGMSMALRSALLAHELLLQHQEGRLDFEGLLSRYTADYYHLFSRRIQAARIIHRLFGKRYLTDLEVAFLRLFPSLYRQLSKKIHGEPF